MPGASVRWRRLGGGGGQEAPFLRSMGPRSPRAGSKATDPYCPQLRGCFRCPCSPDATPRHKDPKSLGTAGHQMTLAEPRPRESQGTTCPSGGIPRASKRTRTRRNLTPPTPGRRRCDVAGGGGARAGGGCGSGSSSGCAAPDVGCSCCRRRSRRCSGPRPLALGTVGTFHGGRRRTQRPGARPGRPGLRSLR